MWRARRDRAAGWKEAVMRAFMESDCEQRVHELLHVLAHLVTQAVGTNAAAEHALIGLAVEQVDQHDGVHREHEETRVDVRHLLAQALHPRREHAPGGNQHVAFEAHVHCRGLDDAAYLTLSDGW